MLASRRPYWYYRSDRAIECIPASFSLDAIQNQGSSDAVKAQETSCLCSQIKMFSLVKIVLTALVFAAAANSAAINERYVHPTAPVTEVNCLFQREVDGIAACF